MFAQISGELGIVLFPECVFEKKITWDFVQQRINVSLGVPRSASVYFACHEFCPI